MSELDEATARWLVSEIGLTTVATVTRALDDDTDELGINTRLRANGLRPEFVAAAITAASARRRAREWWPDADRLLFTREALEQASHPQVSRWRAQRYCDQPTWDLGAGVGGDAMELTETASTLTTVERDPGRSTLLRHNLAVRASSATNLTADALTIELPAEALVHADPARRSGDRRMSRLRDHLPPVGVLAAEHASAAGMGIVLSPAVDLADPDLPDGELEFLQVGDRLVEAVVWTGALRRAEATATLLPGGQSRSRDTAVPPQRLPVRDVGDHLVEVAPAAIRARLHDDIGAELGAWRLSVRRALLGIDDPPPASPWYRTRPVVTVLPARPKAVRRWLRESDHGPIEIAFHGVPGEVDRWWRELGRPPRGPDGIRIEIVRLERGTTAIVTRSNP